MANINITKHNYIYSTMICCKIILMSDNFINFNLKLVFCATDSLLLPQASK